MSLSHPALTPLLCPSCFNKFLGFQVIPVPWPNNTDIQQLSPSHVVVRRCSGGCHSSRSCVARVRKVREVAVMMAKCPVAGGKCEKQCASLEVEDEVECECGCAHHLEEECRAKASTHSWSRESCGCQCRAEEERRRCVESAGRLWDPSSCSCLCPPSLQTCSPGLRLDLPTCSCQPDHLGGQAGSRDSQSREDRHSQDSSSLLSYFLSHWIEIILIASLAFIAVILAILCGVFLRRIHHLQTQLKLASEGEESDCCEDSQTQMFLPSTTPDSQPCLSVDCLERPEFHPSKIEVYGDTCSYCSLTSGPDLRPDLRPEPSERSTLVARGESREHSDQTGVRR